MAPCVKEYASSSVPLKTLVGIRSSLYPFRLPSCGSSGTGAGSASCTPNPSSGGSPGTGHAGSLESLTGGSDCGTIPSVMTTLASAVRPRPFPGAFRTLVRVESINRLSRTLDVVVPAWNPREQVRLALASLPSRLLSRLDHGVYLLARVNIGADDAADLRFDEFELAG